MTINIKVEFVYKIYQRKMSLITMQSFVEDEYLTYFKGALMVEAFVLSTVC